MSETSYSTLQTLPENDDFLGRLRSKNYPILGSPPDGEYWTICPLHEAGGGARHPSGHINVKTDGQVLAYCHACHSSFFSTVWNDLPENRSEVCDSAGCEKCRRTGGDPNASRRICWLEVRDDRSYLEYCWQAGLEAEGFPYELADHRHGDGYVKVRWSDRNFVWFRWVNGSWRRGLRGATPPLYDAGSLSEFMDGPVLAVEGEKDVDSVVAAGYAAVSTHLVGNAVEAVAVLKGRNVVVVPDNDESGKRRADEFVRIVSSVAASVQRVAPLGEAKGYDITDWVNEGGTVEEVLKRADRVGDETSPEPEQKEAMSNDDEPAKDTSTDDARIAEWFAREHLQDRYCWAERSLGWMKWDDRRWKAVTDEEVKETARQAFIGLLNRKAAEGVGADGLRKYTGLLGNGRLGAITSLCRGIMIADPSMFDQRPDLLNVGNGVVNLRTGELTPHDPGLLLTKITNVEYDPKAEHDDWSQALRALPEDVRSWMQARIGQATTGYMTPDDLLVICQGSGKNGKSTFFEGVMTALEGHATIISERALLANPDQHPTELMDLFGARLALIEETPEARHLDVQRLKKTVGTPRIKARRIHRDPVEWAATHSLFVTTNYVPGVDETDYGTWRRLALLTFPYVFDGENGDPGLRDRLGRSTGKQAEAVLRWIVDGAKQWYASERTLPEMPSRVREDTDRWRQDSDAVFRYIEDRLVFDPTAMVTVGDLYADFIDWCFKEGMTKWSQRTFAMRLGGHDEIQRHSVVRAKPHDTTGLVRLVGSGLAPTVEKPRVWKGIRWQS